MPISVPMIVRAVSFLINAALAALVAGMALPGTHRVIYPEAAGLTEIAPRVWTDAPARVTDLIALAETARRNVGAYFGDAPPRPTLILCTRQKCARDFGIGGNGLSVADLAVMAAPGGLTRGTLTHEMTHSRLHRRMGPRNIADQPFPTWFDEGLATHVADHPRWSGAITPADRARVRQARRIWQWDDAMRDLGVGRAYRAAAAEVAAIEARAGRAGLLDLIRRADDGEDFDALETAIRNH
ncbi:MAG: hypothetical protein EX266_00935 [Rhodobacteraceae bacterium]|nr:MAG: hypothetical protein EX266_00935 [Paracoccaceae bacterium]